MSGLTKLTVEVIEARNLESKDSNGYSDPYSYVWVAPNPSKSRCKTKTIMKTLDPVWNQTFEFDVDITDPASELHVMLYDYDRFATDDFLGTAILPLYKFMGKESTDEWYPLQARENKKDVVSGDIHLRVSLEQAESEVSEQGLQVTKERELRFVDIVDEDVLKSLSPSERKRQEILFEFVNTEDQYVHDLHIIKDSFMEPIIEDQLLSSLERNAIFSNVASLIPINESLLLKLKTRQAQNPVMPGIGDIFLEHVEDMVKYTIYCSNQPLSTSYTDEYCSKYEKFAAFLEQERPECRNLPLQGFLVKPLQRLCKYPLLMKELLRCTDESSEEYKYLTDASTRIKEIVDSANERTRQVENLRRIQSIQMLLGDQASDILKHGRQVVFDGNAVVTSKNSKPSDFYLILFTDMVMLTKKKRDQLTVLHQLPVKDIELRNVPEGKEMNNVIELRLFDLFWLVSFAASEEKDKWWSELNQRQDYLLYKFLTSKGHNIVTEKSTFHLKAQERAQDKLVHEMLEEIKVQTGLRHVCEKAVLTLEEKVRALSLENELLEVQVQQFAAKESSQSSKLSLTRKASIKSPTVERFTRCNTVANFKEDLRQYRETDEDERAMEALISPRGEEPLTRSQSEMTKKRQKQGNKTKKPLAMSAASTASLEKRKRKDTKIEKLKSELDESKKLLSKMALLQQEVDDKNKRITLLEAQLGKQDGESKGDQSVAQSAVTEPEKTKEDSTIEMMDLSLREKESELFELRSEVGSLRVLKKDVAMLKAELDMKKDTIAKVKKESQEKDERIQNLSQKIAALSEEIRVSCVTRELDEVDVSGSSSPASGVFDSPTASPSSTHTTPSSANTTPSSAAKKATTTSSVAKATTTTSSPAKTTTPSVAKTTTSSPAKTTTSSVAKTTTSSPANTPSKPSTFTAASDRKPRAFTSTASVRAQAVPSMHKTPSESTVTRASGTADLPDNVTSFSYNALLHRQSLPADVDRTRLEDYLTDSEFQRLFEMGRDEFRALPKWKQTKKKQQLKIF